MCFVLLMSLCFKQVEKEQISSGKAKRKDSENDKRKKAAGPYPNEPKEKEKQSEGFVDACLQDPAFQLWLQKAVDHKTGEFKAHCVVCDKYLTNHKSVLKNHMDKCSDHKLRAPLHEEIMRQRRQLESYFAGAKK